MASPKITFTGSITVLGNTETVGAKGFKKRELVVVDDPNADYPNELKFEAQGERCSLLDDLKKGETVTVTAYINGRKWHNPKTDKDVYFTTLSVNKVDKGEVAADEEPPHEEPAPEAADDDIPF